MDQQELLTRGVAKVIPRKLAEETLASGKKLRVYWGIDPTGAKMHIGHTIPMRKLMQFANAGHHAILVIGSFTAMLGDPSDRDAMRKPLTREQVQENFQSYRAQAGKVLDFNKIEIRYNDEWLSKLTYDDIMKHASLFTVQQMEQREAFDRRRKVGSPLGVHEFLYPLMVGYDSVVLDVDCELGGTDQEFNMLAGRTMQKAFGKREKFVLTTPLIEGTDGRLMSKTYDNCIWLDDSPDEMYGKLLSMKDDLITTYMECCTDIPMEEITAAEKAMNHGSNPKDFKMRLAREIVMLYHGARAAEHAEAEFQRVFSKKELPEEMLEVKVKKGSLLIDVLVENNVVSSKSEARRLIAQKGIHVNDHVVSDPNQTVEEATVKVGKRRFVSVKIR
ncbi:tyrosine--tRNA ligase [Candidatus Peregrinibacteria bacterium]|nr:tyrosine--tRNA ligase [Candidatus Peregrinibacteria bacterium]MBI3816752.1 tyrosine--tRNA ligase [Candidatus Peregrinibacteria bacterium]